jgi:hypothetical protein
MTQVVNYSASKGSGEPWKRLIFVKDSRTHRLYKPTEVRAYVKTGTHTKMPMIASITSSNGIQLELSQTMINDLPVGVLEYDVFATISDQERIVAKGTIAVDAPTYVTPREDTDYMELRFKERSDFRQTYAWEDSTGAIIQLAGAFLQAKNDAGTTVLDLRWYNTPPTEQTIAALPANQRGYLAPVADATIQIHVSDKNSISAGEYPYDLFVITTDGDQKPLFSGVVVVEESISVNPA